MNKLFTLYEVGGKVRDDILGIANKDIDYVAVPNDSLLQEPVDQVFQELEKGLLREGYTIFLSTPSCYTIRAKFPKDHQHANRSADFVLARKEIGYTNGTREPIVVPGTLHDDLQRRDFTCNAIAKDKNGGLIDPFGGLTDIKNKVLSTPISGQITFSDDPLRLLRAIRFSITKGFVIDSHIHFHLTNFDYRNKFYVVSDDRIREELYKCFREDSFKAMTLLTTRYPELGEYIMNNTDIWLMPTTKK